MTRLKKAEKPGPVKAATKKAAKVAKSGVIRARVDPTLKRQVEAILGRLGLNPSDAIRLFYAQVSLRNGLPFEVKIPNAETIEAFREIEAGEVTRYPNTAEMFADLGI